MIGSRNESCNGAAAVPHATQTTDTRPITSDGRSTALACLHSHPMNRDPTVPEQSLVERCLWAITARPVLALAQVSLRAVSAGGFLGEGIAGGQRGGAGEQRKLDRVGQLLEVSH